jgi:hypothetical protein
MNATSTERTTVPPARACRSTARLSVWALVLTTLLLIGGQSAAWGQTGTCSVSKAIENGVTTIPAGDWFTYLINYAYASTTTPGQNVTIVDDLDPALS